MTTRYVSREWLRAYAEAGYCDHADYVRLCINDEKRDGRHAEPAPAVALRSAPSASGVGDISART